MNATPADPLVQLARLALSCEYSSISEDIQSKLVNTLVDSFGVGLAGTLTPEYQSLIRVWDIPDGPASLWGTGRSTDTNTAVQLNGVALCLLELDEGNRSARGHPGAHVIPAAVAEAQRLGSSGQLLMGAILAGYEVAARIANVFRPHAGLHPHGNWGAIGAAAAVGILNGFDEIQIAEAMDAASGLALASPFASALDGSFVRNLWVGAAGVHGINAVRTVQAGLGSVNSTMTHTFGALLGELDYDLLAHDPARPLAITEAYVKRHASCAYTHGPADAACEVREKLGGDTSAIESVRIDTHPHAATLNGAHPTSRLAAMFSLPHVVAVALTTGHVAPESFEESALANAEIVRLRDATTVKIEPEFDTRVPPRRAARVTVQLRDGSAVGAEVPNAIGDFDFHPFGLAEIRAKLEGLLDRDTVVAIEQLVRHLVSDESAATLEALSHLSTTSKAQRDSS
ncbi:MAG: MmgE/PrpD family protein [Microbacteriaceae bacterium]